MDVLRFVGQLDPEYPCAVIAELGRLAAVLVTQVVAAPVPTGEYRMQLPFVPLSTPCWLAICAEMVPTATVAALAVGAGVTVPVTTDRPATSAATTASDAQRRPVRRVELLISAPEPAEAACRYACQPPLSCNSGELSVGSP